jgi:hypothetical protein
MTKPINIEADQNAWRALKLRKQGYGYRAISLKLKCSLSTARGYVKKALDLLRAEIIEAADDLRTIEIEKLDALELQMKRKQTDKAHLDFPSRGYGRVDLGYSAG